MVAPCITMRFRYNHLESVSDLTLEPYLIKMQLDVGNEPYLSQQQATARVSLQNKILKLRLLLCTKVEIHSYNTFRDMYYCPVTDGQTDRK